MDSPDFQATLRAARDGDLPAINRLVAAHQDAVYNLAYRVLGNEAAAAQATEAALVSAMRALRRYHDGPFQVWLLRWLVQACQPALGARKPPSAGTDQGWPSRLAALPPAQRLVLALVDIAGLDYAQAGAVLGLPTRQVRCDLAAARGRLCERSK
jgi:DNA-directed RNA polymerase specialized sigma24 family protein